MMRSVCWLALLSVGAVPDWASAFGRRCWPGPTYYAPAYYPPPPVYCPPMVYYPPPCVPVYVAVPACPPGYAAAPKVTTPAAAGAKLPAGTAETIRPASAVTLPLRSPTLEPAKGDDPPPAPAKIDPPKLDIPKFEAPKLDPPKLELPKFDAPVSPAATTPAPAGANTEQGGPLLPPPGLPPLPDPRKADALPPLVLPPDTPVRTGTTAKSSPLSGGMTVKTYAASGRPAADGRSAIGFYNHTDRDLALTIEGKGVKLPAKSYLTARLGASFTWKHGDNPSETATVPADAVGLDVVFRE